LTPLNELQYYRPGSRRCSLASLHDGPGSGGAKATDPVCVRAPTPGDRLYVIQGVPVLREVMDVEGATEALVVEREFWPGPPRTLGADIEAAPDLQLEGIASTLGLRLSSVTRRRAVSRTSPAPPAGAR
jgi:hypothetical protein